MNTGAPSTATRTRLWLVAGAGIWLAAIGFGMAELLRFSETPGDAGEPPALWPVDSAMARLPGIPTLVMMAHPRCGCTRASLEELSRAMVRSRDRAAVYVLFLRPAGVDEAWVKTDLWSSAAAIPGVTVLVDKRGREARRFGVATSGHVLLYDGDGNLTFSGGITDERGHAGDNPGADALEERLLGTETVPARHFVFGCSLSDPDPAPPEGAI